MKKFFLLVICSCLGLLHAQQAAAYFPSNSGFKWYFQNRPLDSLQQPVDSLKYFTMDSLAGEGTYLGVAAKYVLTKSGPAIGLQQMPYLDTTFLNFANTDGKEYFRVPNLDSIAAIMARYGLDTLLGGLSIINTFKSFEKWYTMYKFASSVNASYTVFTYDTAITIQTANVPLRFLLKGKRLADKSLTTQIGTFACKVFQMDFSMNYLLTIPPFPSIVVPLLTIPDTVYIAPANWQVRKVAPATTMNLSQLGYGSYNFPGLLSEIIPALPVFSSIAVLYPVSGSVVVPGSLCTVRWGSVNVGNVKIEYSTNNGASWLGIINSVSASTGLYNWQVPLISSSECLIRITDADNQSVSGLSGVFQITGNSCKDVIVKAGWNLVSSPLKAANMNRSVLFPTANSPLYGYINGYVQTDTLVTGNGYWLRFPAVDTVTICGTQNSSATVAVRAGWNLIAPFEQLVSVSTLTSEPPNIISSPFYGYAGAYQTAQTLTPGFGYWVRSTQAGIIHYTVTGTAKSTITAPEINQNWVSLTITDASANSSTLYLADRMPDNNPFVLPPAPPEGVFDLRFTKDTHVEQKNNSLQVRMQGVVYPVTLSVKNGSLTMQDAVNGKLFNESLQEGFPVRIENSVINLFNIKASSVPVAFDLLQNYPNPFNPGTTIRYGLSEKGKVKLRILNQLGEEVAHLRDGEENAGMHEIYWDASQLASGVYFMQLQTGNKTLIKKMALIK